MSAASQSTKTASRSRPAFQVATVTLHSFTGTVLTEEQRELAEAALRRSFAIAKRVTERQAEAFNRYCERTEGRGQYAPIYGGWFIFYVNAKGELVDGCGEYGSRDEAIWTFYRVHGDTTPEDLERHRRSLGFPPSRMDA